LPTVAVIDRERAAEDAPVDESQPLHTKEPAMKTTSLIMLLSGLLFAQVAYGDDIQPGSWDVEWAMSLGVIPTPPQTTTICVQNGKGNVKELVNLGTDCSAIPTAMRGNHVDLKVSCKVNGVQMNGTASMTFSQTKVDGTLDLAMQTGEDPAVPTNSTLHAVRTGNCQK
jgi:hypothetical protein